MPKVKIPKESELYFELQGLYETGEFTNDELGTKFGINEKQVRRFAKEGKWERGKEKEYYDAKKFAKERETLAKYAEGKQEYKMITTVSKEAEKKAVKIAEIKINKKLEQEKAEEQAIKIRTLLLQDIAGMLEAGNMSSDEVESFEYNEKGRLETRKKVAKKSKYEIISEMKVIDLLKGLGVLTTQPTVAIQNNQTNTQEGGKMDIKTIPQIVFVAHNENDK